MRRPICTIPQHSAQVLRKPRVLPCLTDPSSLHCDPVKLVLGYILLFLRGPLQNVSRMLMSPALRKFDISNSQSENFMRSVQLKLSGIISLLSVNFTYPLVFPPAWMWDSAASGRSPAWSRWLRISSIRAVSISMRASSVAAWRTAVVTSYSVALSRSAVADAPLPCVTDMKRIVSGAKQRWSTQHDRGQARSRATRKERRHKNAERGKGVQESRCAVSQNKNS